MNNSLLKSQSIDELSEKINQFFSIYDIQHADGNIYFFGMPKEDLRIIFQNLLPYFYEKGYMFSMKYEMGEHILVASPISLKKERRWINVVLAALTVFTTMIVGSFLFGAHPETNPSEIVVGFPFSIAIMTILGAHEFGHYIVARKHGMKTSLPYFIPFPNIIGTMGAVIKNNGPIPNRKALFDVGVSGPLIGLVVSIVVTIIGLHEQPIFQSPEGFEIELGIPVLFDLITRIFPATQTDIMHPITFAGWVGMLVTTLNLIPAGQLDGGHVLRAMVGDKAKKVSRILPYILISLGFYVTYFMNKDGFLWILWGLFLSLFAVAGHPRPVDDDIPIGKGRMFLGIITFVLGFLCFSLVPFQLN